jgi:predicted nucleic acid-binding protein
MNVESMIVADNTLISYFTIDGEFTDTAVGVREKDPEWAAPLLWRSEFLNVLWLHVQQGKFGLDLAIQHIDLAEDVIGGRSYDVAQTEVLRLAVESGCSAYDAHYAALAQQLEVPLVTHDGELLDAFPETAVHPKDFLEREK